METINRLQFRHHNEIFETREDAIEYIYDKIKEEGEGIASGQNSVYSYSLFAEPTILRYKNDEEETGCEYKKGPHIMLVIGSETNDTIYHDRNKFCIIDIDKTEEEIKNLEEEIEKIIKSLTLTVFDTSTLDLHVEKTDEGTVLSGDVKTAETHVFEGAVKNNNLMVVPVGDEGGSEGLFIYVDLTYDDATETFTFVASQADGTLKKTAVTLPNNYLVSGEYKSQDESIHLKMKNGDEVLVNCEELIAEWNVEGDASKTPIVLTREEVDYDHTDDHHHVEPWQDVLRADVRLANDRPANILKKTTDGRYLYVDGVASNILYYWNGERSNVEEQLNKLNKIRISPDNDNIIWNRADGFFASTKLDYNSNDNKLIFTTSTVNGQPFVKEIQLNTVEVIESITYDPTREVLVVKYKNDKGETKTIYVPVSGLIDEWEVLNDAHSVKLVKQRKVSGKDILTADVNISTADNNILEERGEGNIHALFVRGTSDNIKYKDTTVEGALDALAAEDEAINEKLDEEIARSVAEDEKIESTIGSGFTTDAHETVTYKFEQLQNQVNSEAEKLQDEIDRSTEKDEEHDSRLDEQQAEIEAISADSRASLKDIINNDHSIDVDKTDLVKPVISVNLSEHQPYNTIRLEGDGLYSFIDLRYDSDTNKLTFVRSEKGSTENVEKEIQLNSVPFDIRYDKDREVLIITYHTSEGEKTVEIDLHDLIHDEWTVRDTNTIELHKDLSVSGSDILTADVKICHHEDNAIEEHNDGLYVHSYSGEIADLGSRIDTVSGDVITEKARAEEAENNLANSIATERDRAIAAENGLHDEIETERRRAEAADTELYNAIQDEKRRAEAADTQLEVLIGDERTRAMSAETALRNDFVSGDTELDHKIDSLETTLNSRIDVTENRLQAAIDSEKSRAEAADNLLDGKISIEKERAMTAESELRNAIAAETAAREEKDDELSAKIDAATLTFKDTTSINFNDPPHENNVVKADVKIANATDNMILIDASKDGVYASAHLSYVIGTNTLTFTTSAGITEEFQLAGATVIDQLYYDNESGELVIVYHDGTGTVQTVRFPVSELFNEWIVQNPSEKSAVELTKIRATEQGQPDELKARVLITDDHDGDGKPDQGSDNIIEIRNNGLYVKGNNEDVSCISGKTNAIYKTLFGGVAPGGCGEGIQYIPDPLSCVISGATSFMEADKLMAYQICEILEMWVSGMTCTTTSNWVDDGANKKMLVDVRPSYGKTATMTSDDLYITDLTGKTIEHGVNEFTDTNALRIVCLEDGGGVLPDIAAKQNGVYLSNAWNCGKYYQESTEADEMAEVEADGYNVNYFTDETDEGNTADYSNYLRS